MAVSWRRIRLRRDHPQSRSPAAQEGPRPAPAPPRRRLNPGSPYPSGRSHSSEPQAAAAEIQAGTRISYVSEDLAALGRRGFLSREDARAPYASAPAWVYRITDGGARHLSELDSSPYVPVSEPTSLTDDRAYVRSGVRAALRAMRQATLEPSAKPALPDAPEWRTSLQLTVWLRREGERAGHEERFYSGDLAWAVRAALAERLEGPAVLYRITASGLALQLMVWHEPPEEGAASPS